MIVLKTHFLKFILLQVFFSALTTPLWAQQVQLSEKAQVSLITASPGNDLYTVFGHTALRVHDPVTGINRMYNYGTFDFDTQGFYWKFALGDLRYFLSVSRFELAKKAYLNAGRTLTEQQLNMTPGQIQKLYRLLEMNALPENRYYAYEFFYDNCTTRVYDIINKVIGDSLSFSPSLNPERKSFREFTNLYLEPVPWVKFGINLLLGMPADQILSEPEDLFLPDLLKTGFTEGVLHRSDTNVALVGKQMIYTASNQENARSVLLTPVLIFWILLGTTLLLAYVYPEKTRLWIWFDRILFGAAGILGLLILFLWLFSAYPSTKWNLNILWSLPALPLFWVLFSTDRRLSKINNILWVTSLILIALFMLSWIFILQALPGAVIPIVLLLGWRSWIRF